MKINYKFNSDTEPTDEQLNSLMIEVMNEVKRKAEKANKIFFEQLMKLASQSIDKKTNYKTDC